VRAGMSIRVKSRLLKWGGWSLLAAVAWAEPVEFNVPAQPADRALLAFSRQAKVEILFSADALRPVRSTDVSGRLEPDEALNRLLGGTGFVAERNRGGNFVVMPAPPPTGSICGRLLTPEGGAARGLRVSLPEARKSVVTDDRGEFVFEALPPGVYRLVAAGGGFQPWQIDGARVEAKRVLTLEPKTMQTGTEPTRLAAVIVEEKSEGAGPLGRDDGTRPPRTAAGNLDLRRTEDDALPFTVFSREQIVRSGVVNLNEFLQREVLDGDAASRPPEQRAGSASELGFIASSTNLSLRGYGADETVVLVNGRRLPEVLTSFPASNSKAQTPDVNFIPLSLVQRVEVLPVSASALYSGNPVGGVINIVLRPDVNTSEVTATYTNALGGFDAPQFTVSLQQGQAFLRGALRMRFNASFTRTLPPTEGELGYIQANLRSHPAPADALHRATPNIRSADQSPLFGTGSASVTSVSPRADGTGGLAAFTGRQGVQNLALFDSPGGLAISADSVDFPYGRRQRGENYYGSVAYDVRPWLEVGLDGIYARTVVNRGYTVFPGDLTLGAASPLNPFGKDVVVSLNETAPRLGENYSEAHIDFYSAVLGLLVKLPADWRGSLDAQYGHNFTRYRGLAGVDSARWQQLVDQRIYNPLRDTQVFGPPPEFYDRALIYYGGPGRMVTLGDYNTLDAALRISNQALRLPTGTGAVSAGGDFRKNHLEGYTNEQRYGDGTLVGTPGQWSARTLRRTSVFGELQAPLLPARWLPSWLRTVETDLAARYIAADTTQETNVAPTGGLKIDLAGGISLRGTVATSNRFPTPSLSRPVAVPVTTGGGGSGGEVSYTLITDPRRVDAQGRKEVYGVISSDALNPSLRAEAAVTRTAGAIFQRGRTHRLRLAVDFVDTQKSGEQTPLNTDQVLSFESLFPERIARAVLAPGDNNAVGRVTSVLTGPVNLAFRHSQNWNTAFDFTEKEFFSGSLELYGRWVYFQRYEAQVLPTSPTVDELRQPSGAIPGLLKHRVNFGAGWSRKDFGFGMDGHYFHSRILPLAEQPGQGRRQINPHWQFDAYVQGDLARWLPWKNSRTGLRAQLRVNNLTDTSPPTPTLRWSASFTSRIKPSEALPTV